jgi:ketosteroid isomerase-like protein
MSQENVEIVRRLYDAAAHRDSDAVLAIYDPVVEVDMSRAPCRDLVGERFYQGHDGLRAFYREWYGAWKTVESEVEEVIDVGGRVITVETTRGRGWASGAAVEVHQCGIWTIRDGKVVRVEWLDATRKEALEAAGVREHALAIALEEKQ